MVGTKIRVTTIKPGPTHTPMVEGLGKQPLLAEPEAQAKRIVKGLLGGAKVIYTPGIWKWIMMIIRQLPDFIFDKLNI